MSFRNPFRELTRFELLLWVGSIIFVTASFVLSPSNDYLTLIASIIGVTALIFVAKGYVVGQVLTVIFAVFYGIISFYFKYYGEMITYLGMTSPIAIMSVVSWLKHPYENTKEVEVNSMKNTQIVLMIVLTVVVTFVFYFILKALDTANLIVSTISVAMSFLASYLTFMRSPYYGLAYGANDVILILLWILATMKDIAYLPMVICFVMFLVNDLYGFINWNRIKKRQKTTVRS